MKIINQFETFVIDSYDSQKSKKILDYHKGKIKRVFSLFINLFIWSFFGITIDTLLVGTAATATYLEGIGLVTWLPTVTFLVVNFIIKGFYVRWYMRNYNVSFVFIVKSVLPYLGGAWILRHSYRKNKLYKNAVYDYKVLLKQKYSLFFKIIKFIQIIFFVGLIFAIIQYFYF